MQIIRLNEIQFNNYSNIHKNKNICQTIEYSQIKESRNKNKIYLGLLDENDNVCAACLVIENNLPYGIKMGYIPGGFLIDYENFSLLNTFIEELKTYLKIQKYTYIITNPLYYEKIITKNKIVDNTNITNNFKTIGLTTCGYPNNFSKYDIIINNSNYKNIYENFNRNTKRSIKQSINMGIILEKGTINDIDSFYELIRKKTSHNIHYYNDLMNMLNSNNIKMELFFSKLNPKVHLINAKKNYLKEKVRNEKIQSNFLKNNHTNKDKLLNKKIASDQLLEKLKQEMIKSSKLYQEYPHGLLLGSCALIRNNKEVYFLIDGYNEKLKTIHSSHILKWKIIKHYSKLGYKIFNLGEISNNYQNSNDKYNGLYLYKKGFGGDIIQYPPDMLLIIDNNKYFMYKNLCKIKRKSIYRR